MLSLFDSFVVPDVPHVTIYRDDQEPHTFYMVPEFPSVATGPDNGPLFNLIAFARDFRLSNHTGNLNEVETEGGLLNLTTQLAVSQDDQQKIRDYIQNQLLRRFAFVPLWRGKRVQLERITRWQKPIKLSYPIWASGKVAFYMFPGFGETFIKATEGSKQPSLTGENLATYVASLGQEGLRLFREALRVGLTPGTVNYEMMFVGRIPNVTILVKGNMKDFYQELKEHSRVTEVYGGHSSWSYPAVSSLEELRSTFRSLKITVDGGDFRSSAGNTNTAELEKRINEMALTIIQNYLTQNFCVAGFQPGLDVQKLGTNPFAHNPHRDPNVPPPPANQLWLKEFSQEIEGEIDFSITARQNIEIPVNPNTSLTSLIAPAELNKRIVEANLSQPFFSILDVPIKVTANFEHDPIAAIQVFCDYKQTDERTGQVKAHTEAFTFDTGNETYRFRTVMARAADGTPKDTYTYRSRIVYKASAKSEETALKETNERTLLLGYDELNCVWVHAQWGAISSETVERVMVSFEYPGLTTPTAKKDIFLTLDNPIQSWFTYTGDNQSREYIYQVTYFLVDGQRMELPAERTTTNSLVINAPFDRPLEVTFIPQGTFPPLAAIVVSARYRDEVADYQVDDVHTFTGMDQNWTWRVPLRDRNRRDFEYKVDLTYADGSATPGEYQPGSEGVVLVGNITRTMLDIEIVPTLLDMDNTWKLVIVRLHYEDPANQISQDEVFKITATNILDEFKWSVPLKDPDHRTFSYTVQAFGYESTNRQVVGPIETSDNTVVLDL
jgi:hypothetical protein